MGDTITLGSLARKGNIFKVAGAVWNHKVSTNANGSCAAKAPPCALKVGDSSNCACGMRQTLPIAPKFILHISLPLVLTLCASLPLQSAFIISLL